MKVAIDISPLQSGHNVRGVGFYLSNLLDAFTRYTKELTVLEFVSGKIPRDAEIVHYPYFDPFFITLPLRYKIPTIITIHDLTPIKFPHLFPAGKKGIIKWQIQRQLAKKAAAIITDSENSKKDVNEMIGFANNKIFPIHLAAAEHFRPLQLTGEQMREITRKYNLPERFILYVGDVTPNKNLPVLLDAVEMVKIPLVMVGKALASQDYDRNNSWNKDLGDIQKRTKDNTLIHILGFVPNEDLVALYNMATVFVMPSFYEGFGLPLLEAMSCGTPAVAADASSLPEVGGKAVVYADAAKATDFAEKILTIINNKDLAQQLNKAGLEQAKKFSWQQTATETLKVYESVMKK